MVSKLVAAGKAARAEKKAADAAATAAADGKTAAAAAAATTTSSGISLRRMLDFARPEAGPLAISVATLAVTTGISLVFPYAIGEILDVALKPDSSLSLNTLGGGLLGLFVVQSGLIALRSALLNISGERIAARLRNGLFKAVMSQEIAWFDSQRTGDIITRLSSDVTVVQKALTSNIANGLKSVAMSVGCIGMLVYTSPSLAALSLALIPPVAVAGMFYGRFLQGQQKAVQEALGAATSVGEEVIGSGGLRTVRQFGREREELQRFMARVSESFGLSRRIAVVSSYFDGALHMAANASLVAVLWHGGSLVFSGEMTAGGLTAFMMYALYTGFNIASLSSIYTDVKRASGAAGRIVEIMDRKPTMPLAGLGPTPASPSTLWAAVGTAPATVTDAQPPLMAHVTAAEAAIDPSLKILDTVTGNVGFKGVTFAYPQRPDTPVLNGFSLDVPAGSNVVLVGGSGAGKSTVGALLTRLYDPQSGTITVDGHDIKTLDPTWLRKTVIGTVSQEPTLFAATIADNIRFGRADATDKEVEEAARMANIHDTIMTRMPKGYETVVGERGVQLSGGQRQRVAIARAVIKRSPIMILDESTSSLDSESEAAVMAALDNVAKGRTVISIAHRLSTMKHADMVAVLQNGAVAECGPFDALFSNTKSQFRQLIDKQTMQMM